MMLRRTLMTVTAVALALTLVVDPLGLSVVPGLSAGADELDEDREGNRVKAIDALELPTAATATSIDGSEYQIGEADPSLVELAAVAPVVDEVTTPVSATPVAVELGGIDLTVAAVDAATPAEVRLNVLDGQNVPEAGLNGVLLAVTASGTVDPDAELDLTLDYSTFAGLEGGDWSSRLRMVYIPACAETTPLDPECALQPVETVNDPVAATLSAVVPVDEAAASPAPAALGRTASAAAAASTGKLAVIAGASGAGGDWGATSLSPSSSWAQSGSSGAFTWSYPMPVPLPAPGPAPQLNLSYSSSVSDGRTPASNNQSGWIGEGFDLSTGYIERSYVACDDDQDSWNGSGQPNNHDRSSADLCWREDNATLVFQGAATELVKTGANSWVPKVDDGTLVTHETSGGDDYWKVVTVDGTAYYFGRTEATKSSTSGSAWTVPVYGNHVGEPCHASTFAASDCRTVWRWNIDKAVDTLGNEMTYAYAPETNYFVTDYAAGLGRDGVWYTSGGRLTSISYGTPTSGSQPLARVDFESTARCLTSRNNGASLCTTLTPTVDDRNWPDTPKDLQCDEAEDCKNYSPVFFNTTRLSKVHAKVLDGSSYRTTDTWDFTQQYLTQGASLKDTTNPVLTLTKVTHTAKGLMPGQSDITLLPVEFTYEFEANRVDSTSDGYARLLRPRVISILLESRGLVSVKYEQDPNCTPSKKPRNPSSAEQDANPDFCYPVRWNPNGTKKTQVDWFHKYKVRSIIEDGTPSVSSSTNELTTGSLSKETYYEYGKAGWAKPKGPLIDPGDGDLTFSEFRGARSVGVRLGSEGANVSSETTYYLGLGGTLTGGPSNGQSVTDSRPDMAGQPFAEVNSTEPKGEASVRKVSETLSLIDSTQKIAGAIAGHDALRVTASTTRSYTYRANGDLEHASKVTTEFDGNAQPVRVVDAGDLSATDDDVCTVTTYASLTGNKVSFPASTTQRSGSCESGTLLSRTGASYDPATVQVLTETTAVSSSQTVTNATYTYDARGRVTRVVDAEGNATDTAYTLSAVGQVTQITTTHPDPDGSSGPTPRPVTRAHVDPLTGVTTKTVDANGKETTGTYDALERVLTVRYPQHATTLVPSMEYAYETRPNGSNIVVTRRIAADGVSQHTSVEIMDGLLRTFQTQAESRDTGSQRNLSKFNRGRVVSHVLYDEAGRVATKLGPWFVQGAVTRTAVAAEIAPPARTDLTYDLAGRVVKERFCVYSACDSGEEKWSTTTHYDGATTITVPPQGGVPTGTVVDARGQVVKTIEYLRANDSAKSSFADITALSKQTTTYSYDGAGRRVGMKDPAGNTWTYAFDLAGRQTSATDPDSGTSTSTYDDMGRPLTRTDARGQGVSYTYDKLGRTTKQFHIGNSTAQATWTYDTAPGTGGAPVIGQLASSTRVSGGLTYTTTVLGYDEGYQRTGVRTTLPTSTALKALSGKSFDVTYTYTADGQVASTTLPAVTSPGGASVMGKETVTTIYDSASTPSWMTGGFGWGTYVAESRFDYASRPVAMDLGTTYGAVVTYAWEEGTDRLQRIALDRERVDGTEIALAYDYDDAGNITSVSDTPSNEAVSGNVEAQCFRYDALRRLTSMWTVEEPDCGAVPTAWSQIGGPAPMWTSFGYDTLGNRTSKTARSASGSVVTTSTFGAGAAGPHQLTSQTVTGQSAVSFTWDAAGNRTGRTQGSSSASYTWDAEGELVSSTAGSSSVSSVYDADGSRLVRFDGANATVYLPGGMEVSSSSSTAVTAARWYSFAGKTVAYRTGNGLSGVTSVVTDQQGTIVGTVHNTDWAAGVSRKRPDPFGGARSSSGVTAQGRGFLGAPHDSSALVLLGARYFDPGTGTFASVDPLLDPMNPAQFNAYVYSGNNPVTWSDPSGLTWSRGPVAVGDEGITWVNKRASGGKKKSSGASVSAQHAAQSSTAGEPERRCTRGRVSVCPSHFSWEKVTASFEVLVVVVGFIPVLGEAADGVSAGVCVVQGDMECAALSAASAVPFLGWGAGAARFGKAGERIADASSAATKARGLGNLTYASLGIAPYRTQRLFTSGKGGEAQAHHLIEQRFRQQMGGNTDDWPTVVVTRAEHQAFTNAWRTAIPYRDGTRLASRGQIEAAAREVYRDYPAILETLGY